MKYSLGLIAAVGALATVAACGTQTSAASTDDPHTRCAPRDESTTRLVAVADAMPPWVEAKLFLTVDTSTLPPPELTTSADQDRWAAAVAPLEDEMERELTRLGARAITRSSYKGMYAVVRVDLIAHLPCVPHVLAVSGDGIGCTDACDDTCAAGTTPLADGTCPSGCNAVTGLDLSDDAACVKPASIACASRPLDSEDGPLTCYVDVASGVRFVSRAAYLTVTGFTSVRACTRAEGGPVDPTTLPRCGG